MKDVLHILNLLKRQAESKLAQASRARQDTTANMEQIKTAMETMRQTNPPSDENQSRNLNNWLGFQQQSLMKLSGKIPQLDSEILQAFKKLEQVVAKLEAATKIAHAEDKKQALERETAEDDAMLELSLLRRLAVGQ